ncbi:MAG TPA: glycosyltransferase family 4 protein, partial [Clostridia bacterium]|nr:glycosyltransferase family 4 protein [Clostridia bacterium]
SDVAVFPSLYEPFGIVALEGMATKTPVVVSDTGGISGIVDHGVDGLKAYTGDSHSLAEQIMAILQNPKLGERLKNRAYEKVQKIYNWGNIARETLDTYRGVLDDYHANPWIGETKQGNKIFNMVPRIFGRYN